MPAESVQMILADTVERVTMKYGIFILGLFSLILVGCGGRISLQEQEFITLKAKDPTIHVPTPFVLCTYKGQAYPEGTDLIISHIKSKMEAMAENQLKLEHVDFENSEAYVQYGNALVELIVQLERKDMEDVTIPQTLKTLAAQSPHDMSVFVFNVANPKSKAHQAGRAIGTVALGITIGMLTGFTPVMTPFAISSKLHFIIYSKSKDMIISYEDSEDKDDPMVKENIDEEVDMLFSKFVEAGII